MGPPPSFLRLPPPPPPHQLPYPFPHSFPHRHGGHKTCKHTYCTYKNGVTDIYSMGNNNGLATPGNEKFHCEKFGSGCKCVCDPSGRATAAPFATTTLPATRRLSSTAKPSCELYV